jgi:hypothetical protein
VTPSPGPLPNCGFHVVFDAGQHGPDLSFAAFGLIFVVIGVGLFAFRSDPRLARMWRGGQPGIFPALFLGFAILWTTLSTVGTLVDWQSTQTAIHNGAPAVEGVVSNFHPMPATGHEDEHFTVQGVYFAYSDYEGGRLVSRTQAHTAALCELDFISASTTPALQLARRSSN